MELTVDQLKDLITHAKDSGVVRLCYNGVEIVIDVPTTEKSKQISDDDLLYYSS